MAVPGGLNGLSTTTMGCALSNKEVWPLSAWLGWVERAVMLIKSDRPFKFGPLRFQSSR